MGLIFIWFKSKIERDNRAAELQMSEADFTMGSHYLYKIIGLIIIFSALIFGMVVGYFLFNDLWATYGTGQHSRDEMIMLSVFFGTMPVIVFAVGIYYFLWQSRYKIVVKNDDITIFWMRKKPYYYRFQDITRIKVKGNGEMILYRDKEELFNLFPYMTGYTFLTNRVKEYENIRG